MRSTRFIYIILLQSIWEVPNPGYGWLIVDQRQMNTGKTPG